jgi:2-polyprenyl-6-methoxyphenol hydroxylase-like FAD-dependent oxidoreductase
LPHPQEIVMFNVPGRAVSLHPAGGEPVAAFIFRARRPEDFDHRDGEQHKRILREAYRGVGWRVPELLEAVEGSDELYFDAVSRVSLPTWSAGRVAVVGDAASSVSLFGDGSTLAVLGAKTLADAISDHRTDHGRAFRVYEQTHRPRVAARHRNATRASRLVVPGSQAGLTARNLAMRTLNAR